MRRGSFCGVFLFVEGESDDRLFRMFVDRDSCQIICANTRAYVISACAILSSSDFAGAIGIVDADFDTIDGRTLTLNNVFMTDCHDIECTMLSSPAFYRVFDQFVSFGKYDLWIQANSTDIRIHLLREVAKIGCLLRHSNLRRLNLVFDGLEYGSFTNRDTLIIDIPRLVQHVMDRSMRHDLSCEELSGEIDGCMAIISDFWQVSCGHHFMEFLGFAFRFALGSWSASDVRRERFELDLRLAYALEDFRATRLFALLREWETLHRDFRVFKT